MLYFWNNFSEIVVQCFFLVICLLVCRLVGKNFIYVKNRLVSFCFIFIVCGVLNAQFSSNNYSLKATQMGEAVGSLDEIFFFNKIIPSTAITYTHSTQTNFKWYRFITSPASKVEIWSENNVQSTTLPLGTSSPGYIENGDKCGYVLEFEGQEKLIWVFDLMNENITFGSFQADHMGVNPCYQTRLLLDVIVNNPLQYYDALGVPHTIPRKFNLVYYSLDSLNRNTTITLEKTNIVPGSNEFIVDAPFKTTMFSIEGDQFFTAFNDVRSISTTDYTPVAVQANLKAVVAQRKSTNEVDRLRGELGGSAPLVVDFTSNTNTPIAQYFEWYISSNNDSTDLRYYIDENLRYTFEASGLYKTKLVVSNATCLVSDSINATVLESFLEVPNVFTPNGDGRNDEFRVAFKSIEKFRGIVFNRWGRKVFEWDDPGKGWDGRIGKKIAQPGAYYYIIEAVGADIDPNTKKQVTYLLKGDINLLRGK